MLELPTVKNYFRHLDVLRIFMKSYMRVLAREAHEIFRAIVSFLSIDVVNNFLPCQISPKNFLDNKSMLKNIHPLKSVRMIRSVNQDIAGMVARLSTVPMSGLFGCDASTETSGVNIPLFSSVPRVKVRHSLLKSSGIYSIFGYSLRHTYLQIKKAVFSGLSKTVKFSRLLTARIQGIKNPFSIDTCIIPCGA